MEKRIEIYLHMSSKFLLRSLKIIPVLFFTCFSFVSNAQWLSDFSYRKPIEINHNAVTGISPLTDYPMMVSFTDPNLAYTSSGGHMENSNGYDVDFTLSDGTTTLDFEIEKYNPSTGEFVGWVRIPSLPVSSNTMLYMYYGNSSISSDPSTTDTWNSDYIAVWHLGDNYLDATDNNNDATAHGTSNISGEIGEGDSFDGNNDYIQTSSNELRTEENFTISAWFRTDNTSFSHHLLWQGATGNGYGNGAPSNHPEMNLSFGNIPSSGGHRDNVLVFHLGNTDLEISDKVINIETPFSDKVNWANVVVTVSNMSVNPSAEMFLNGTSVGTDNGTLYRTDRSGWNKDLRIGRSSPSERYFDGEMDEIRIMRNVVSDDMIRTTFNNISDPPSFFNTNATPIDISLSGYSLDENMAAGSVVGTLTTSDPDISDIHTYSLVSGTGDDDNSAFVIAGNELRTSEVFNYETKSSYSIRIRTTDNGLDNLFYEKIISITVNDLNEQPVYSSVPDTAASEDEIYTYNINITDDDSDPVTIDANTLPSWLTLIDNGDGTATLSGTPTNDNVGSNEVELVVSDGSSSTIQNFSIEVENVNDTSTFTSTPVTTATEDEVYTYIINTTDDDGDPVTIDANTLPSWLTLIDNGDGTATLIGTPTNDNVGSNEVELVVSDGSSSTIQNFSIEVENVNDTSTFTSTPVTTATEDEVYTYIINTTDDDGDPVTIDANTLPSWLTLIDNGDGTATLSGTPTNDNVGSNEVELVVSDGSSNTVQNFSIEVENVNDTSTFTSTPVTTAAEDEVYTYIINTTDADGDPVTIDANTLPSWLTLTDNGDGTATLIGTPTNDNVGSNEVELVVSDGSSSTIQNFSIEVENVNDTSTFTSTPVTTATEDEEYVYIISTIDSDGDPVTISADNLPSWLTLVDNGDGTATLSGTPTNNEVGNHTVQIEVNDGTSGNIQIFDLTVENVNDMADFISTPVTTAIQDEIYTYIIETGDEDGDHITILPGSVPSWLTLTDNGDGTATLTGIPSGDEVGIHDIVIIVDDGNGSTQQDFIITVQGSGNALKADEIILTIDEDEQLEYNLIEKITDIPGLTVSILSETSNGEVSVSQDGELIYTPVKDFYGEDSLTYIVCNNEGLCDTAGVKIIIQPVNDAPILINVETTAPINRTVTECLSVEDIENDNVYISDAFVVLQEGDVNFESNSLCLDYTPAPTFMGEETIEVTICDDGNPSMCQTFNIKVHIDHNLVIHEGISPNGDGLNDQWIIEGIEYYPENTVRIFNRSGMKVYEVNGYDNEYKVWNGAMNKGIHIGNVAPDGTYYYFIYLNQDKKTKPIRGYIVIN